MSRSRRIRQVLSGLLFVVFFVKPVVIQGLSSIGPKSNLQQRLTPGRKEALTLSCSPYDDNESPPVVAEFDDRASVDDDDTIPDSFLASPLSQAAFDEEEEKDSWYPGSFSRQENWLEEASAEILDREEVPLGSLTEEDVDSIAGIMSAWIRRRSLDAALHVETLLKRVVDDMRAGNNDIHVTARMYTIVSRWKIVPRDNIGHAQENEEAAHFASTIF